MEEGADSTTGGGATLCEIGSIPFPDSANWLIIGVANFQQFYGELHPYFAVFLCIVGRYYSIKKFQNAGFFYKTN